MVTFVRLTHGMTTPEQKIARNHAEIRAVHADQNRNPSLYQPVETVAGYNVQRVSL